MGSSFAQNSFCGGYQGPYDTSESSEIDTMENWVDDSAFYERFDQEIYKFVDEVERQLNSVAPEREILTK